MGGADANRQQREDLWERLRGDLLIAPSLLSADFARLADAIAVVERAGARVLHLDVMDGHFVPNITFGPPLVSAVRRTTDLWLDAHLMVRDPLFFLEPFARAGADGITVHIETGVEPAALRDEADRLGIKLGLAIRPDSPVEETLRKAGDGFDLILVMTVMPGFGGQAYMPGSDERLAAAARYCADRPASPRPRSRRGDSPRHRRVGRPSGGPLVGGREFRLQGGGARDRVSELGDSRAGGPRERLDIPDPGLVPRGAFW